MKRYALFAGDHYYPSGGWHDFAGFFDSPGQAKARASKLPREPWERADDKWWHIVDLQTGEIIEKD
jgi:hypothetical protein